MTRANPAHEEQVPAEELIVHLNNVRMIDGQTRKKIEIIVDGWAGKRTSGF